MFMTLESIAGFLVLSALSVITIGDMKFYRCSHHLSPLVFVPWRNLRIRLLLLLPVVSDRFPLFRRFFLGLFMNRLDLQTFVK